MITKLKDLEYIDRLKALKLPSLQYRRDHGDMIECYKFTHGHYKSTFPFTMKEVSSSRGHSLRFAKKHSRLNLRQHFFSNRAVNLWNALPESVADAPKLNTFKNRLDRIWNDYGNDYKYSLEPIRVNRPTNDRWDNSNDDESTVLQA